MEAKYSATYEPYILQFKKPAGTSRGFLNSKKSWILYITDIEKNITGRGECSLIPGLSIDNEDAIDKVLGEICHYINQSGQLSIPETISREFPAIQFAFECAVLDLEGGGWDILFQNNFSQGKTGIPINGLVWMADPEDMYLQAAEKLQSGYRCIKFKVGALDFDAELKLFERIRKDFGQGFEIRLDANGAFKPGEAMQKLEKLSKYGIHSIEQPIAPRQYQEMAVLCRDSPIPIALDEELIGLYDNAEKELLLQTIQPQYIILKPSLIGGFNQAEAWIAIAQKANTGWWATSALEANIGLNAIAQWTGNYKPVLPQGLGTGSLYVNNLPMPLAIEKGELWFKRQG